MRDRTNRRRIRTLLVSVPLGVGLLFADLSAAHAQQRPRNLMEMLFGPPIGVQEQRAQPRREMRRQQAQPQRGQARTQNRGSRQAQPRRQGTAAAGAVAAAPAAAPVEKAETARDVLVIGDFMAASLVRGLTEATADNRDVRIVGRTEGSSGLVRDDFYDWIGELPAIVAETTPDIVVVMLGSNDRQALSVAGTSEPVRSDAWTAEYTRRVEALAAIPGADDIPLVWVGMPSFQANRMSEDMVFLNAIFREAATEAEGQFVDVWNGFVDAGGDFITSGPDPDGQPARLRNSDGITMTAAGAAKLAYYAEEPIVSRLGLSVGDMLVNLGPQQMPDGALPAAPRSTDSVRTEPIALSDPRLAGADALLGGPSGTREDARSPRDALVLAGSPPAAAAGRADSFSWGAKGAAVSPTTHDNAIVFRGSTTLDALRENAAAGSAAPAAPAAPPPAAR